MLACGHARTHRKLRDRDPGTGLPGRTDRPGGRRRTELAGGHPRRPRPLRRHRPALGRHRRLPGALRQRPDRAVGELRGGRGQAGRRDHARRVPGPVHHPGRRQRRGPPPTGLPQGFVRPDGDGDRRDRHGVRRHHPHRTARRLAPPGGRGRRRPALRPGRQRPAARQTAGAGQGVRRTARGGRAGGARRLTTS
ncbi:conserved hypothetical protein [Streptomyces misionensis JCM 4497]